MRTSSWVRKVAALAVGGLAVASAVTLSAPGAGADTVSAALGARTGSGPYAGLDETRHHGYTSTLAKVLAPGRTGKFSLEVLNNGTASSSFDLHETNVPLGTAVRFLVGKTDVTSSVQSAAGLETPTLAPGKTFLMTAELTAPRSATAGTYFDDFDVALLSADQTVQYGETFGSAVVGTNKGTTDHDLFVKAAGGPPVRAAEFGSAVSKTIKPGQKATYVLTAKNDSTTDGIATTLIALPGFPCPAFAPKAMFGKRDITAALFDPNEQGFTVDLDAGKSAKITLTVTLTGPVASECADYSPFATYELVTENNGGNPLEAFVTTNSV